jgi:hypothetical protein
MGKDHRDQPSGSNKQEDTGVNPVMPADNLQGMDEMKKQKPDKNNSGNIKEKHPHRNRNKDSSTNAGGYRQ